MSEYVDRLRANQSNFENATMPELNKKIPDGEYVGVLTSWEIKPDFVDVLRLSLAVVITGETEFAGCKVFPTAPLEGDFIGQGKHLLKVLGMDVDVMPLEVAPEFMKTVQGKDYKIRMKTYQDKKGNDRQSCFVIEQITINDLYS